MTLDYSVNLAIVGVATAYIVNLIGIRQGLFIFSVVAVLGLFSSIFYIKETMPWAKLHQRDSLPIEQPNFGKLFVQGSWRDFGYAVVALTPGMAVQMTQALTALFLLASVAMILSGLRVLIIVPNRKN